MRIRTIKPEWLDDERMVLASSDARVVSIALILMADDYGNGRANDRLLVGRIFPGEPAAKVADALRELADIEFITLYTVRGQGYYSIRTWSKHQRVDNAGKPRVPGPLDADGDGSRNFAEVRGETPLDPDLDHDQEHRSIRAREAAAKLTQLDPPLRDTLPAPPVQTTRGQVSAAFAREYEQRRGILWNATSHFVDLEGIAEWIDRQASREGVKPDDVRKRLMANWFAHKWGQKCDFKPRELLKCIGEVYAPPVIEAKDEPDPEVINARRLRERKRQEERELHEKLNGHAQTASKPPALEELLVGIGRRM